mgnify:CR=1 FL=1
MTHYDPRPGINRTMEEMQAENEQLRAEAENAGNREVKAWAARDQYMESNVKLVAMVERLRAALEDARHYAAVCPVPAELTGPTRIEMLERRARIAQAAVHEQSAGDRT